MSYDYKPSDERIGVIGRRYSHKISAEIKANKAAAQKSAEEAILRAEARAQEIGTDPREHIIQGSDDRMNAVLYNPEKYDNFQNQNAYREGFINHGNRRIVANLKTITPEELKNIGYNDYLSGIGLDALPDVLSKNFIYLLGYNEAKSKEEFEVYGPQNSKRR